MEHTLFQSFQLLHAIVNTNNNSLEYQMMKRQLSQEKLNVLKKWQEKRYVINKRKPKLNTSEQQQVADIIIPGPTTNTLTIVSDKPKRKYVRQSRETSISF